MWKIVMEERLRIFKALSDETRLKILDFLLGGEKCVCEIIPHVKRTQSTVSIQLAKLERLGILRSRKDGRSVYYALEDRKAERILGLFRRESA